MMTKRSRRSFLRESMQAVGAAAMGPMIVRAEALGLGAAPGANYRVQVGYIGVGRRSRQLRQLPQDAAVVAFSDVNQTRLDDALTGHPHAKPYRDYREMLALDAVDAVVIATPDHWHALCAIHACAAGKDVYVEKPVSLTIREGRAMVEAARRHKRIMQSGSQQRSMLSCQKGCQLLLDGAIGKVHTVHGANYPSPWDCDLPEEATPDGLDWDLWLGQTPHRGYHPDLYHARGEGRTYPDGRPLGWISYRPYSGGEMTGWGAHGLDIVQWALGKSNSGPVEAYLEDAPPANVVWVGKEMAPTPGMGVLIQPVTMRFADGTRVMLDGKGPGGGAFFEGDAGTMLVNRGEYVLTRNGKTETFKEPEGVNDTDTHLANWMACIRNRELPAADIEIGHRAATLCHLGNIVRWVGERLAWDPEQERFTNSDKANALLEREMRTPWTL